MKKIINPENEIESLRKSYENDSSYAHALKDLIEKNDSYGKIFAMSLLCLILNIAHKKWTTKDDIKKDFKNAVNLIIGSSDLDEKEKGSSMVIQFSGNAFDWNHCSISDFVHRLYFHDKYESLSLV